MRKVWVTEDNYLLGGIGTSWLQRYGLSRDRRTGAWTLYDRRDGTTCGDDCTTWVEHYPTTEALIQGAYDDHDWMLESQLEAVEAFAQTDLIELAIALRARLASEPAN